MIELLNYYILHQKKLKIVMLLLHTILGGFNIEIPENLDDDNKEEEKDDKEGEEIEDDGQEEGEAGEEDDEKNKIEVKDEKEKEKEDVENNSEEKIMIIIKKVKIIKMKPKKELLFQLKKKIKKLEMRKLLHNK